MATDQEIREAGFKYIPQQKYLQNHSIYTETSAVGKYIRYVF